MNLPLYELGYNYSNKKENADTIGSMRLCDAPLDMVRGIADGYKDLGENK